MRDLAVIVPSRGRPTAIVELAAAFEATQAAAHLIVGVDLDDPALPGYRAAEDALPDVEFVYGPRERLGPTLNRISAEAAQSYWAVGFMGDDHRPRTPGWDATMVAALRRLGTGVVYGNDLLQGAALPTAVVMTSDIVQVLGWMVPPGMIHMYLDNFWKTLGEGIDRLRYLPDVVIEHMHPVAGKAAWDDRYREVNAQDVYTHDRRVFRAYLAERFETDCARINLLCGSVNHGPAHARPAEPEPGRL